MGWLFESTDGVWKFLVEPGPPIVVGRRPPIDGRNIRIPETLVARQHLRIGLDGERCTIEDAESHCGISIDGARVQGARVIEPGTAVRVAGHVVLVGRPFVGERLRELMRFGPLPWPDVRELLRQLGRQLAVIHAADRCRGIFLPYDVLRAHDGGYVLVEAGWPEVDEEGKPMGNLTYTAPEWPFVPASDVYTLGLIAYEALAAEVPFPAEAGQEMMAKYFGGAPKFPPGWDPGLQDLFLRLLMLKAAPRPTAAALVERLEQPHLD